MNRLAPLIAVATVVLAVPAFSQDTSLGESCDLAALGAKDTQAFLAFDKELRAVVAKQDAVAMALLVDHPLRVGDRAGFDYYLDDPGSFQNRYQQIFTPAVRDTILKQPVEKLFCNWTGVMYGSTGVVWCTLWGTILSSEQLTSIRSCPFQRASPPVQLSSSAKPIASESLSIRARMGNRDIALGTNRVCSPRELT